MTSADYLRMFLKLSPGGWCWRGGGGAYVGRGVVREGRGGCMCGWVGGGACSGGGALFAARLLTPDS